MEIIVNGSPYELIMFVGLAYYAARHVYNALKQK